MRKEGRKGGREEGRKEGMKKRGKEWCHTVWMSNNLDFQGSKHLAVRRLVSVLLMVLTQSHRLDKDCCNGNEFPL